MSQAKHLDDLKATDRPAAAEPAVFAGDALGPVGEGGLKATTVTAHAADTTRPTTPRPRRSRAVFNGLLILSLLGLLAFGAGVFLALALLDGALDLKAGWLKDILTTLKSTAHHLK